MAGAAAGARVARGVVRGTALQQQPSRRARERARHSHRLKRGAGEDASMADEREDLRLRLQRKTRFTIEAVRPPPPLPASRIAWAGGPIVTSDKTECLRKLIKRKMARKQPIPPELQVSIPPLSCMWTAEMRIQTPS
eukprot:5255146-Pleurochrysis_carterae.AAC.3